MMPAKPYRRRCPSTVSLLLIFTAAFIGFRLLCDPYDGSISLRRSPFPSSSAPAAILDDDPTTSPIASSLADDADLGSLIPGSYVVVLKPTSSLDSHFANLSSLLSKLPEGTEVQEDLAIETFVIRAGEKQGQTAATAATGFVAYAAELPEVVYDAVEMLDDVELIEPDRWFGMPERWQQRGRQRPGMVQSREIVLGPSKRENSGKSENGHYNYDIDETVLNSESSSSSSSSSPPVYILSTGFHLSSSAAYSRHFYWSPTVRNYPLPPRVRLGYNAAISSSDLDPLRVGTGLASILGSPHLGCSPASSNNVTAVKIFDDSGRASISGFLSGITWAVTDAIKNGNVDTAVIVLGVGKVRRSRAVEMAIDAVWGMGALVVRPGDETWGAVGMETGMRVGVMESTEMEGDRWRMVRGHNRWRTKGGSVVDVVAPGTAAVVGSTGEEEVVDGREVAAAWAAGIALRIRSEDPKLGPDEVKKRIIGKAWRRRGRFRGVVWGGEGRG